MVEPGVGGRKGRIWFLITLRHAPTTGETWRCQNRGTGRGLFGGSQLGGNAMQLSKPAGPSTRAKAKGSQYPQCGGAMMPDVKLGEAVYSRPGCGGTFERA